MKQLDMFSGQGRQGDSEDDSFGGKFIETTQRVVKEQIFERPTSFLVLSKKFINTFATGDTTPDVLNKEYWRSHTVATSVTAFTKGQPGQTLHILGNGNTTLVDGPTIKTNTGANKLLLADIVYRLTNFDGIWYEDE